MVTLGSASTLSAQTMAGSVYALKSEKVGSRRECLLRFILSRALGGMFYDAVGKGRTLWLVEWNYLGLN